jgi:hypothetical protein
MEKLQIAPNTPTLIALKYAGGRLVDGRFGKQVYYTLAEPANTCLYLDLNPAQLVKQLEAKAQERFWIQKTWTGKRNETPTWDAWFDRDRRQELTTDLRRATQDIDRQLARLSGADGITPAPVTPTAAVGQAVGTTPRIGSNGTTGTKSITKLEHALKTVVAAIHATNQYAKSIGYTAMPQFTSEDLRCMANTLLIGGRQ